MTKGTLVNKIDLEKLVREDYYDVAIVGGGPAGLQATLILARTRKKIIVFDSPDAPRNGASHGVHNFLGLDGLLPEEIREQAWQQIEVYDCAELRVEQVIDVQAGSNGNFLVTGVAGSVINARHVILAMGFRDFYPDVPGFLPCWGDTIIACPYCDGYENRDRVWGLVVNSQIALEHMPMLYQNWTSEAKILLSPDIRLEDDYHASRLSQGVSIHEGEITEILHTSGKVSAVSLRTGETVEVGTLWWRPDEAALPLTQQVIQNFDLARDENGYIQTDASNQTDVKGLWAVGDIRGWATTLGAAYAASQAAYAISHQWYANHNQE